MFSRIGNLVSLAGLTCFLALGAVACAGSSGDDGDETQGQVTASKAREGEVCGNGFFGTPKVDCAAGLTCEYPASTAPTGPNGSSSALPGKCAKPRAAEGETCGNGFFGMPNIDCAEGLVCEYPASTAPTGPSGSSSALPGKCAKPRAAEGETCGNGFFGTPDIDCAEGLVCQYPPSTAPTGPNGSSSALPGKCAKE